MQLHGSPGFQPTAAGLNIQPAVVKRPGTQGQTGQYKRMPVMPFRVIPEQTQPAHVTPLPSQYQTQAALGDELAVTNTFTPN